MKHYLDNAATSWPKPEAVYQTLDSSFRGMFSPKRGTATAAKKGAAAMDAVRESLANLFNISNMARICFTPGCSYSLNTAIQAFPWQPGDGVIMSAVEHHALSRPVRKMAAEKGVVFHVVPYTDETPFDLAACEALLKAHSNIKLIATLHASNVIGAVLPVEAIGALAKQYQVPYLLDAAQSAGVLPVDVQAANVSMLAVPAHKSLYGPPGIGMLYVADGLDLAPFVVGGTGNDSGKHDIGRSLPGMIEVGTLPLPLIQAFREGVHWVLETGLEAIHRHEALLLQELLDGLTGLEGVTVYGHTDVSQKTPVVSFNVAGWQPVELGTVLYDTYGIALRAGFHCAPMAHEAIGSLALGGTVRASLGYFTQPEDVAALIQALKACIAKTHLPV